MHVEPVLTWDEANNRLRALRSNPYVIGYEPAGTRYDRLLHIGLRYCALAVLAMQAEFEWSDRNTQALRRLSPWLVEERHGAEWPGTRATRPARLLVYEYSEGFVHAARSLTRRLFQWEKPNLPEDLCLFRATGEPWLGTIAHERSAWLNLTARECAAVGAELAPVPVRRAPYAALE